MQKKLPLINSAHGSETRNIINELIKLFNDMGYTYNESLQKAQDVLNEAKKTNNMNKDVQDQLDNLIIESGNANAEVSQARGGLPLLKDRLDKTDSQLVQTEERSYSRALLNKKKQTPSIVWIDDDGLNLAFDRLAPHARTHDIPMSFAVVTSWLDNGSSHTFSREEVVEAYREGFEILDHSYAHDFNYRPTEMTSDELREDLTKTKKIWADLGIPNNIHVIPFGANTPTTTNIYREFFDASIMTTLEETGGVPNFLPLNNYRLGRVSYTAPTEHILAKMDDAVGNNGLIIMMSHMGVDDYDEDKVNAIITNAKSKGLEWITMQEALNRFGNIANFGNVNFFDDNIIQADGTMSGDIGNKITSTLGNSFPINAPITHFKEKTTTSFTVPNPQADSYGLPINDGGYIDTVRAHDDGYSYQLFVSWRTGEIRLRKWDHNENEWKAWRTTGTTLASDNNYNLDTQPSRFDYGTTYSLTSQTVEEGSPEGNNGTLITHKTTMDSFIGRTFQEYHANTASLSVYKRRAMNNTTWSEWKKVSV